MGADNRYAGFLAGSAVGEQLATESDCGYDRVFVLESLVVGEVGLERTNGMKEGFESVCGPIAQSALERLDVGGAFDITVEIMTQELEALPVDGVYVVLTINESVAFGASVAAEALDRQDELRIGTQGVQLSQEEIACEPQWVASTAFFPERYGNTLIAAMIDFLDGETLPTELLTPHVAITADNIRDFFPDTPDCT